MSCIRVRRELGSGLQAQAANSNAVHLHEVSNVRELHGGLSGSSTSPSVKKRHNGQRVHALESLHFGIVGVVMTDSERLQGIEQTPV